MKVGILLALIALVFPADAHKILCIFGIPSKSHNLLGKGIVNALLKAGHEVTWLTPYPSKDPLQKGLSIIDGSAITDVVAGIDMMDKRNADKGLTFVRDFSTNITLATAAVPQLREALTKGQFDAVVTETFFNDIDAGYAAILQVPWIVLSGVVLHPSTEALVDEVKSIATVPLILNDFPIPMGFWHRLMNVAMYAYLVIESWWMKSGTIAKYEAIFKPIAKARGVPLPPLDEAVNNVAVLFVNSHSSFAPAQSVPPNVIDIGGYHIEETIVPLPKDLQEILDSSPQGVVYFSMGSVVKSSNFPLETRKKLVEALGQLPYTVLWKFEEQMEGLPKNVHIRPWMPQPAILAHKNTRAFVTHGGLLSSLEALRFGVPAVCVPVFGDQPANAARAVRLGHAVSLSLGSIAAELGDAVREIMTDDRYYKRAKYLSYLFNNRPVPPSKLISHYVELAIESKGAHHLRSKAKLYSWYQRWMLDLLAFILAVLYLIYKVLRKLLSLVFRKKGSSVKTQKKAKKN